MWYRHLLKCFELYGSIYELGNSVHGGKEKPWGKKKTPLPQSPVKDEVFG